MLKNKLILLIFSINLLSSVEYNFSGDVANYSKFGFNHTVIDETTGHYPTDSFSIIDSNINFDVTDLNHFTLGVGLALGGIIYDSTKYDKDTSGKFVNPNGLAYKYLGYYAPHNGKEKATALDAKDFYLSNLYAGYENEFFSFKIGRFVFKNTDWLTGNQEGAEIHFKTSHTDTWGVLTDKKASLGGKWLKDFKYLNSSPEPTLACGVKINYENFTINPYIQTQLSLYVMPAISFEYKREFELLGLLFSSKTNFSTYYIYHTLEGQNRLSAYDNGLEPVFGAITIPTLDGYKGRLVGKGGESFLFKQIFYLSHNAFKHDFGFQFYGNVGNANEFVGGYGNPLGIDLNDSTIYDRGTANNAIFASDAFSNIFFYGLKYQNFKVNVLNRYTMSNRSNEESFSLNMDYFVNAKFSLGLNMTYFDDKTKKDYQISQTLLPKTLNEDRSYVSTYIKHLF